MFGFSNWFSEEVDWRQNSQLSPLLENRERAFQEDPALRAIFDPTNRVQYYLGNLKKGSILSESVLKTLRTKLLSVWEPRSSIDPSQSPNIFTHQNEMNLYYRAFQKVHPQYSGYHFAYLPGDRPKSSADCPLMAKTRPLGDANIQTVILPFTLKRHFGEGILTAFQDDTPFEKKANKLVWRGASTGRVRLPIARRYMDSTDPRIDIGLSGFSRHEKEELSEGMLKAPLSMQDQMQCKYILALEGNDLASGLPWILATQSVCVMPEPTVEGWMMNGRLEPWVHFVPVAEDGSDIPGVLDWCEKNQDQCRTIVENSRNFMLGFSDFENERKIVIELFRSYAEAVSSELDNETLSRFNRHAPFQSHRNLFDRPSLEKKIIEIDAQLKCDESNYACLAEKLRLQCLVGDSPDVLAFQTFSEQVRAKNKMQRHGIEVLVKSRQGIVKSRRFLRNEKKFLFVTGLGSEVLMQKLRKCPDLAIAPGRYEHFPGYHPYMFERENFFCHWFPSGDLHDLDNEFKKMEGDWDIVSYYGDHSPNFFHSWPVTKKNFLPRSLRILHCDFPTDALFADLTLSKEEIEFSSNLNQLRLQELQNDDDFAEENLFVVRSPKVSEQTWVEICRWLQIEGSDLR